MSRKILFLNRHGPFGSNAGRESLDAALIAAAFDQQVSLLFVDDGVLQLVKNQSDAPLALKDVSPTFKSLGLYEIESVYVDGDSLKARGLTPDDMLVPVAVLEIEGVRALIEAQDAVLGF